MPNSMHSSAASANFPRADARIARIGWRPSRWLIGALAAMTLLAVVSLQVSELPVVVAWPAAVLVLAFGAHAVRREARRTLREFVFAVDGKPVLVDGVPQEGVEVCWRGPLSFVSWHDASGCRQRLSWWPDTLPPPARRELRLAAAGDEAAAGGGSMAP